MRIRFVPLTFMILSLSAARASDQPLALEAVQASSCVPRRFNVRDFGALGNGVHDDRLPIQKALNSAAKCGGTVYLPAGIYPVSSLLYAYGSNMTISGDGPESQIVAGPNFVTDLQGLLTVGLNTAQKGVDVQHVVIRDLLLDGRFVVTPLYITRTTFGRVSNVIARQSSGGVISVYLAADVTVDHCTVSGGRGKFGDGIGFHTVVRPTAESNSVSDVTRMGIVTEQVIGYGKSEDALIVGNVVTNAHDSVDLQSNAGIWLENTDGGRIIGNRLSNLLNNPAVDARGISIGSGTDKESSFIIDGNDVSGVDYGCTVGTDADATVSISGLTVKRERGLDFFSAVNITSADAVSISNLQAGANFYEAAGGGAIVVDPQNDMTSLSISTSSVISSIYAPGATDLHILSSAHQIKNCTASGMKGWSRDLSGMDCTIGD